MAIVAPATMWKTVDFGLFTGMIFRVFVWGRVAWPLK